MKSSNVILAFTFLIFFTATSFAQDQSSKKVKFSLEVDPVTFGFGGYGFHLRFQPKSTEHLLLGIGAYGMNMPQFLVDLNAKNKGWKARLNQGYGVFAEHYFSEVNNKWFVGGQLGVQEYNVQPEAVEEQAAFTNLLFMAYGGYTWKPFGFNLYIKPWFGVGYTSKIAGENTVENATYDLFPITMFATLHIGYTF
ncbi:MAG: hypothetical protein ACRBFS_02665 [Aureispira sp.]